MMRAASGPIEHVREALARALVAHVPGGAPIAIALSGGRDSVVLFDALCAVAPERGHRAVRAYTSIMGCRRTRANGKRSASRCAQRETSRSR